MGREHDYNIAGALLISGHPDHGPGRGPNRSSGPSRVRCAIHGGAGRTRHGPHSSSGPTWYSIWPLHFQPGGYAGHAHEFRADNALRLFRRAVGTGCARQRMLSAGLRKSEQYLTLLRRSYL